MFIIIVDVKFGFYVYHTDRAGFDGITMGGECAMQFATMSEALSVANTLPGTTAIVKV